jgi:hypothetical protein
MFENKKLSVAQSTFYVYVSMFGLLFRRLVVIRSRCFHFVPFTKDQLYADRKRVPTWHHAGPAMVKRPLKTYQFFHSLSLHRLTSLLARPSLSSQSSVRREEKLQSRDHLQPAPLLYAFPRHTRGSAQKISNLVRSWYRNLGSAT